MTNDICPDCNGTKVYRGLNHEEPCRTCTPAVCWPTVIRPAAEVEAEYGLRPGSLAPQAIQYHPEIVSEIEREVLSSANRSAKCIPLPLGQMVEITGKLQPVAQDSDGQIKPIDELVSIRGDIAHFMPARQMGKTVMRRVFGGYEIEHSDGVSASGTIRKTTPQSTAQRIAALPSPARNVIGRAWIAHMRHLVQLWHNRMEDCDSLSAKSAYQEAIDATKDEVDWMLKQLSTDACSGK